jgi:lipopolysaccharide assembly protein A
MQFLKILFWCLVAFAAAMFTTGNRTWVAINLWGGLVAEVFMPLLLLLTFLAGAVPVWLYFRAQQWRLAQRLATAERVIADLKPVPVPMGPDALPAAPAAITPTPPPLTLTP